jgi:hypothetical protein
MGILSTLSISRANCADVNTLTIAVIQGLFCRVKRFHLEFRSRRIKKERSLKWRTECSLCIAIKCQGTP